MGLDAFARKGIEQVKKGARIGVTGLAMTGGSQLNVPIPAEIEGLKHEVTRAITDGLHLRGTMAPDADAQRGTAHAAERQASNEVTE